MRVTKPAKVQINVLGAMYEFRQFHSGKRQS